MQTLTVLAWFLCLFACFLLGFLLHVLKMAFYSVYSLLNLLDVRLADALKTLETSRK